ncbi:hypothetical protein [Euzebya sp.]|uniref:hypothetical protein n=1 Tax=Euzebya sp. TaxID=1971409 RepID=UPI00351421DD
MILVDDAVWRWRGRLWAHSDVRLRAVERGAVPVGSRELVRRLRAAGLRKPSRA